MAAIERKTKRYPSDLTDEEWERIAPLVPKPAKRGRKPSVDMREVLNAIRSMTRSGDKAAFRDFVIEVVRRIDNEPGFKVLPRRWIVERSFGWLTRWRCLVRDYEQRIDVSEAMIHVAMGSLLVRRISH